MDVNRICEVVSMSDEKPKICAECKWSQKQEFGSLYCFHPKLVTPSSTNLVTGEVSPVYGRACNRERFYSIESTAVIDSMVPPDRCGYSGNLWEPAAPPPVPEPKLPGLWKISKRWFTAK